MGKVVGALLGFITFGFFGAIAGGVLGHFFDKGLGSLEGFKPVSNSANVQQNFFETLFLLLGMLAKSDGRVSEQEVESTELLIRHMGLNADQREQAIALFKQGAQPEFDVDACMKSFVAVCGGNVRLQQSLLEFLLHLAFADQHLHAQEKVTLEKVAFWLGVRGYQFEQLLAMAQAQYQFGGQNQTEQRQNNLGNAYKALGVSPEASMPEIKKAYRKLMSEHHPDKLIAQGVPDSMIKLANEKSAEISAAYELISKARSAA